MRAKILKMESKLKKQADISGVYQSYQEQTEGTK